ncbi:type IV pilus assembly protein PilQ [Vibrio ichthyoenteri ATCC 700023]|uniref:Type IV pilus assembly protein PilQ n=1 Tax=Vibrio ichthyoenteri ATCC 700023 TaxID=870968 RepID=F9S8J7_9VIBR|nr:type IV pilus secretin PilQ family protein [Vibrio ichthyoenteri]EGU29673.1 type IV pilus assembly protein PilQ [Vibrio ichthyoenteri ATCC 700023]
MIKGRQSTLRNLLKWMVMLCMILSTQSLAGTVSNQLLAVDFRMDENQSGKVVLELSHEQLAVDIQSTEQGLVMELFATEVDESLLSVFDVQDFATNVQTIEVFRLGDRVRLLINIKGRFRYQHDLKGNILELLVSGVDSQEQNALSVLNQSTDNEISINFQDISVRHVLQLIADYNDFNLVVSDAVSGNLTLRLEGVPWPQVLDIILQVKGLDKRVEGNVVLVAPKAEFEQREKQRLENARIAEQLTELHSEIIKIHFANAGEIAAMIGGSGAISMLSSRGSITVDERTNALLIRDLAKNVDMVRTMVASLDIPVKQVQIEARIVTVNEGNLDELGVRWSLNSSDGTIGASHEGNFNQRVADGVLSPGDDIDDFLNVNLAASAGHASGIAFQVAKLGSSTLLDLELSALQRESKAEVISSPRLITTNKKPAYIEQGTEIPYLESTSSGASSVSFRKAVLSLKVTPQITPDNHLILDLSVTQDRPGEVVKIGTGEAVSINTQRIGTQVLVENGETVVLGGIYQHSVTDTVDKVPLLGDIPYLGSLFRRSYQRMGKSELLIFVTPKVVMQ